MLKAASKALAKSLTTAGLVLGPGFVMLMLGMTIPGVIWLFCGSFGLMAWTYRKPWRLGWISCLIPPATAALCYWLQIVLFGQSAPHDILLYAIGAGLLVGFFRARSHKVTTDDQGGIVAQRTFGYLLVWVIAYGATQGFGYFSRDSLGLRAGLVTGAFSTAMLAMVSLMIWGKFRKARASIVTLAVAGMFASGLVSPAPTYAMDGWTPSTTMCFHNISDGIGNNAIYGSSSYDGSFRYEGDQCDFVGTCAEYVAVADTLFATDEGTCKDLIRDWGKQVSPSPQNSSQGSQADEPVSRRCQEYQLRYHEDAELIKRGCPPHQRKSPDDQISEVVEEIAGEPATPTEKEEVVAVAATIAAILIAAGVAANIAQAIAAALANAIQSGVQLTAEQIDAAIIEGLAQSAEAEIEPALHHDGQAYATNDRGEYYAPDKNGNWRWMSREDALKASARERENADAYAAQQAEEARAKAAEEDAKAAELAEYERQRLARVAAAGAEEMDRSNRTIQDNNNAQRAEEERERQAKDLRRKVEQIAEDRGEHGVADRASSDQMYNPDGSLNTEYLNKLKKTLSDRIGRDQATSDPNFNDNSWTRILKDTAEDTADDAANSTGTRFALGLLSGGTSEGFFQGRHVWNAVKAAAGKATDEGKILSRADAMRIVAEEAAKENLPVNTAQMLNRIRKGEAVSWSELAASLAADGMSLLDIREAKGRMTGLLGGDAASRLVKKVPSVDGKVPSTVPDTPSAGPSRLGGAMNRATDEVFEKVESGASDRLKLGEARVKLGSGEVPAKTQAQINTLKSSGKSAELDNAVDTGVAAGKADAATNVTSISDKSPDRAKAADGKVGSSVGDAPGSSSSGDAPPPHRADAEGDLLPSSGGKEDAAKGTQRVAAEGAEETVEQIKSRNRVAIAQMDDKINDLAGELAGMDTSDPAYRQTRDRLRGFEGARTARRTEFLAANTSKSQKIADELKAMDQARLTGSKEQTIAYAKRQRELQRELDLIKQESRTMKSDHVAAQVNVDAHKDELMPKGLSRQRAAFDIEPRGKGPLPRSKAQVDQAIRMHVDTQGVKSPYQSWTAKRQIATSEGTRGYGGDQLAIAHIPRAEFERMVKANEVLKPDVVTKVTSRANNLVEQEVLIHRVSRQNWRVETPEIRAMFSAADLPTKGGVPVYVDPGGKEFVILYRSMHENQFPASTSILK